MTVSEQAGGVSEQARTWTLYECPECGRARLDSNTPHPERWWCDGARTHPEVLFRPVGVVEAAAVGRLVEDAINLLFAWRTEATVFNATVLPEYSAEVDAYLARARSALASLPVPARATEGGEDG